MCTQYTSKELPNAWPYSFLLEDISSNITQYIKCSVLICPGFTTVTELAYDKETAQDIVKLALKADKDSYLRLFLYKLQTPVTSEGSPKKCVGCCPHILPPPTQLTSGEDKVISETKDKGNEDDEPHWKENFIEMIAIKIVSDGSPHCGTMAVRSEEPYLVNDLTELLGFPTDLPYGALNWESHEMLEKVREAQRQGMSCIS